MSAGLPKISVLTTVKNSENYIREAIDSILAQTFVDFEFLILDDGSSDNTPRIIQEYATKDKRIRFFKNQNSQGIPRSRNFLVKIAESKYLAWQDGDDISLPTRLEKQYNFMENHPEVGICGGYKEYFGSTNNTVREYSTKDAELRKKIFLYSPLDQPVAMIRKEAITEAGWYDESLAVAQDLDMSFRIGQNYQFANIPEVLLKYRETYSSAMHKNLRLVELNTLKIRLKYAWGHNYHPSLFDLTYNFLQFTSIFIIPKHTKIWLFHLFRDTRRKDKALRSSNKLWVSLESANNRLSSIISSF